MWNWGRWAHRAGNSGIISLMPFNMVHRMLQWFSFHRICGALHLFFIFHYADELRLLRQCSVGYCYLTHSLVAGLYFVSTFWLPFTTLNIWHFAICWQGMELKGATGGREVASITSICFLFKFCICCQGSWWQGCIKCFCGCKSELMRAEKNTKKKAKREREEREKGREREKEIAAVASCNAFNLYARPGKPSKYNNKIKKGKEKE